MKNPRRVSTASSSPESPHEAAVQQAPTSVITAIEPIQKRRGSRGTASVSTRPASSVLASSSNRAVTEIALVTPTPPALPTSSFTDAPVTHVALPNRLQNLASGDRPQERLQRHGAGALSDSELLAMLLRSGTHGHDVLTLSNRLISDAGSLAGLIKWSETDFKKLKGIGRIKALQLITVMEVARRVLSQSDETLPPVISSAEDAVDFFRPLAHGLLVEKFWVLCLNRKNRLIKCIEVTSGTASATLAHPREVFRDAIKESACAILCAHNHPSGDPAPSTADIRLTRQLREASETIDITLLDHVIIGQPAFDPTGVGHYSFRAAGII